MRDLGTRGPGGGGRRGRAAAALRALLAAGLLLAGAAPAADGQEWREFRAARQAAGIGSLEIEVIYGVGRLEVGTTSGSLLYDARLRYDRERFTPVRGWRAEGPEGHLLVALTSSSEAEAGRRIRLDEFDLDLDFDDLKRLGDSRGRLDLGLHPDVPIDLTLAVGAAESRLELGGLSLTSLDVATGASRMRISFDVPNRGRMGRMTLKAGAADFRAEGLGNARFERFRFEGGVGDVVLDFSGDWEEDATVSISMGLGQLALRVPSELGVSVRRRSVLAAFDASGFTKVDGAYRTSNWDGAEHRLEIDLEAAFGAVTIERAP